MIKMGVVADDVTGANDIGGLFAKNGYRVHIYPYDTDFSVLPESAQFTDITILDTNSRLDAPALAYSKVFNATQNLRAAGCQRFFKKTCSVFRGNIGVEFDAMLDALKQDFAVVVLGFPKNGRTTVEGMHYVHGRLLEESEFRSDPIHPMTRSSLVEILASQTRRVVRHLNYRTVQAGAAALHEEIQASRGDCSYLVLDVTCQEDLPIIARVVADQPVLCGSSALAEELPVVWGPSQIGTPLPPLPPAGTSGILCIAGSLMPQTISQVQYLSYSGADLFELNTVELLNPVSRLAEISRLVDGLVGELQGGQDAILHSTHQPDLVAQVREEAAHRGFSGELLAHKVSEALAEVSARVLAQTGSRRLVVAGGETSAAVCRRLGVTGFVVLDEIQPGLPACQSLPASPGDPSMLLILKSGSFGSSDFLVQAVNYLRSRESSP